MSEPPCLAETFLEQCPACHWIVGEDLKFQSVYGDSTAVFNRPASRLIGRSVHEALAADLAQVWQERFERVFRGETLWLRLRYNGAIWNANIFPIRPHSQPLYAGGFAREATPWSTAEQELRH